MGLALMAVIWVITLASTYFFVAKTWWLPVGASAAAAFYRRTTHPHIYVDGNRFPGGATVAGLHRLELSSEAILSPSALLARQHQAGNSLDGADYDPVRGIESDGQPGVGEPAIRSGGAGRSAGGSDGDAVCLVLPLSGAGWEVWSDVAEVDGSIGGRRGRGGIEHQRSGVEG